MALSVGAAISLLGPRGPQGVAGSRIYFISGTPTDSNASAVDGDLAFATDTNLLYQRTGGAWPSTGTLLRGAMGLTGVSGASFYSGPNPPDSTVSGNDGDLFLVLTTGEIYKHVSGSWADQGYSIKGPTGVGQPGLRGTQIFTGSGNFNAANFSNPSPVAGDLYLDTSSGNLYVVQGS